MLPLWETRPLWLACYSSIWKFLWSLLYLDTPPPPSPQVTGEAAVRTRDGSQAGSDAGWGDREPPSSDSNLLFPLLGWEKVSWDGECCRWVCVLCAWFWKKMIRQSDSGNTEWSRAKKPLGDKKLFWALCFSPVPVLWKFWTWVTQSLCRCYFLCNTNTTAVQKNQRGSDRMKDKESVVEETVAGHQGLPAVFSHWPNLVSFFSPFLSWFPSLWSRWSPQPSQYIKLAHYLSCFALSQYPLCTSPEKPLGKG